MRILIFSLAYYPRFVAGAEVAIKEITDRIPASQIEFDLVTLNGGKEPKFERIGNVNVYRVLNKMGFCQKIFFPVFAFFKASNLYRTRKYNVVWSMMASYAGFAGLLFKKTHNKIPFLLSLQEGENFGVREGILKIFFKSIIKSADSIQVISNFLSDWARNMGAKASIVVIPNAVDFDFFSKRKSDQELEILKQNLGKKPDDIFLITTGRLVIKNATSDIIDALQYLPEKVKFIILGKGYQEKMLKDKVARLNLKDRVQFLGFISHNELPQYLHVSDIFIRPSLSEGFGNSYIEAMAAKIPVIATPVGGIVDFLHDGETGLFAEVQNPKSIAQKVEKLIKDTESRQYIVRNAEAIVREKYDWALIANDMRDKVFLKVR